MKKRLLVLTDHLTHSDENSIYRILSEMRRHPACGQIDVASRGLPENRDFYFEKNNEQLYGTSVGEEFSFHEDGRCFKDGLRPLDLRSYDFVFMRLPHPTPKGFGAFLENRLPQAKFVNRPLGIELTGSKAFLLHFPEVSPP